MAGGYIYPETGDIKVQRQIVPVSPSYKSSIPDWGSESFSFQDYGFMPTEQPYISKAQEKVTTVTLPGVHGSLIQPVFLDATNAHKNWEARTGSLDFYYLPNGINHSLWDHDLYAHSVHYSGNDSRTDENHDHPWCFFGQYHKILHFLQGRRGTTLYIPGEEGGFGNSSVGLTKAPHAIRMWCSKVKPDNSGRTTVTVSYDIQPGFPYCDQEEYYD
jgi:hypothetical protein|uniref:hypothetical protein n=1 Tax=Faecalibacterium prausnitzii TaxID=853 RepID=UPI002067B666|nr:MAG TPA: hypothetical protein [Caudoviricetes sp.]